MKHVAVIGCGNIGRRHIQGLGKSSYKINIHVYDKSKKSLEACKTFVKQFNNDISNLIITFYSNYNSFAKIDICYDLLIVATTAYNRYILMKHIVNTIKFKNLLLEKPLCQSFKELINLERLLLGKNVWINHWRRLLPWYKELKKTYFENSKIEINVLGPKLGIGCNISHYVDLVNFFSSETPLSVDTTELEKNWHNSKRDGFKDVDGIIKIKFSKGSCLKIESNNKYEALLMEGIVIEKGHKFAINEQQEFAVYDDLTTFGEILRQSELTGIYFDKLVDRNCSDLTPIELELENYRPIIKSLLAHWQSNPEHREEDIVPLT